MAQKTHEIGLIIKTDAKGSVQAIEATNAALKKFERQVDTSSNKSKGLDNALKQSAVAMGALVNPMGVLVSAMGAATTAGAAYVAWQANAIKDQANFAKAIGINIESLTSFAYALKDSGLSTEQVGDILKDTSEKIGEAFRYGTGEAQEAIESLGLDVDKLARMQPDQQMLAIASALEGVGTQAEKIQIMEAFGNDAILMLPILEKGTDYLRAQQEEAKILGVTLSEFDTSMISQASSDMGRLGTAISGAGNILTAELAPAFGAVSGAIVDTLTKSGGLKSEFSGLGDAAIQAVASMLDGFDYVSSAINAPLVDIKRLQAAFWEMRYQAEQWKPFGSEEKLEKYKQKYIQAFNEAGQAALDQEARISGYRSKSFLEAVENRKLDYELDAAIREQELALADKGNKAKQASIKETSAIQKAANDAAIEFEKAWIEASKQYHAEYRAELEADQSAWNDYADAQLDAIESYEDSMEQIRNELELVGKSEREVALIQAQRYADAQGWSDTQIQAYIAEKMALFNVLAANKQSIQEVKAEFDPMTKAWENAFDRMDNEMSAMFRNFEFTAEGVFDVVKNSFKTMIAEMAYQATIQPILVGVQGSLTGNPVGGATSILGSIGNAYSAYQGFNALPSLGSMASTGMAYISGYGGVAAGGQAAMLASQTAGFGSAGASLTASAAGSSAGIGSTLVAAAPYLAAIAGVAIFKDEIRGVLNSIGIGGKSDPDAFLVQNGEGGTGNFAYETSRDTAFGTIGFGDGRVEAGSGNWATKDISKDVQNQILDVFTGLDASLAAYFTESEIEGAIEGLSGFMRKSWSADGVEFEDWIKARYQEVFEGAFAATLEDVEGIGDQMVDQFDEWSTTIRSGDWEALAVDSVNAFAQKFMADINLSTEEYVAAQLKGMEALRAIANDTSGDLVNIAEVSDLSGESLSEYINYLSAAKGITDEFSYAILELGDLTFETAGELANLSGGVNGLAISVNKYYDAFYTEAEKTENLIGRITNAFSEQNILLPETREGYRALVEAQNLGIESDRERYVTLLQLSSAADEYYDSLEDGAARMLAVQASLQSELLRITDETAYNAQQRAQTLDELLATGGQDAVDLQKAIWEAEDIKRAAEEAAQYAAEQAAERARKKAERERIAEQEAAERARKKAERERIAEQEAAERARIEQQLADEAVRAAEALAQETQSLTDRYLQLTDLTAYESMLRERQLAALDPSNRALQEQIWLLEEQTEAAELAKQAQESAIDNAYSVLQEAISAEKDLLSDAHSARMDALSEESEAINQSVSDLSSLQDALGNAFDSIMSSANQDIIAYSTAQAALVQAYTQAQSGNLPRLEDINDYLSIVSSNDASNYASQAEFLADQKFTANVLAGIGDITGGKLSIEEQSLAAIESQIELAELSYEQQIDALDATLDYWQAEIEALERLDDSVLTVAQAVANLQSVISGEPVSVASIPAFASGGIHSGGIRLVGEQGPELEFTGPSRIMNNSDTMRMLDNSELVAEVKALRNEVSRLRSERKQDSTRDYKELSKTRRSNEAILSLQQPETVYTGDAV